MDLAGQIATDLMAASLSIFQMIKARNTAYGHKAGSAPCVPHTSKFAEFTCRDAETPG